MAYDVTEEIFYGQVLEFSRKTIVRYMENRSLCGFIGTYHEDLHRSQAASSEYTVSQMLQQGRCLLNSERKVLVPNVGNSKNTDTVKSKEYLTF